MTSPDLSDLIERVEAAEEGSRELDAAIQRALGSGSTEHWFADVNGKWVSDDHAPLYSTSLDAAMMLVPDDLKGDWSLIGGSGFQAEVGYALADAATPSLALCAAALKARALQEKDHPHD